MFSVRTYRYLRMLVELMLFALATVMTLGLLSLVQARAQRPSAKSAQGAQPPAAQIEEPLLREYRGVQIGMSADQARQKLGAPRETSDRQDFFVFSEAESALVYYDAQRKVMAVSANFLGETAAAPAHEKVFGSPAELKADGSIYKLVRYQRAGYFVVYSRTAGDSPLVTVTMQKILD